VKNLVLINKEKSIEFLSPTYPGTEHALPSQGQPGHCTGWDRAGSNSLSTIARVPPERNKSPDVCSVVRALCLEITDDGCGLPEGHRTGVGLISMQETIEKRKKNVQPANIRTATSTYALCQTV
jgi:hypothetical protein